MTTETKIVEMDEIVKLDIEALIAVVENLREAEDTLESKKQMKSVSGIKFWQKSVSHWKKAIVQWAKYFEDDYKRIESTGKEETD